jgi:dolichol-phosphate mannosyltransferase
MNRIQLSIVIPIFNEEETIPELGRRLATFLASVRGVGEEWEVVFVDDGSRDRSPELLAELARTEKRYKVLGFSRNFGHQIAITAGVDRAEGDAVVVMDADLQDPPELVGEMLEQARAGFDLVYAVRRRRQGEGLFKRATAAGFYRFMRVMTGVDIPVDAGDFRLMTRPVVLTLRALREQHRFVRGMVSWVGFRQSAVYYDRDTRFAGETKYPLRHMLRFAIDGITSFSTLPLRFATWLGVLAGLIAVATGVFTVIIKLIDTNIALPRWTGLILMAGILGEYVGRIYEEVKRRPLYIATRELNFGPELSHRPAERAVFTGEDDTASRPGGHTAPSDASRGGLSQRL